MTNTTGERLYVWHALNNTLHASRYPIKIRLSMDMQIYDTQWRVMDAQLYHILAFDKTLCLCPRENFTNLIDLKYVAAVVG